MGEFFSSLINVKKNTKEYKVWDKKWDDKEAQRQALHAKTNIPKDRLEKADALGKTVIHAIEVMDQNSEDNTENVESITQPIVGVAAMAGLYLPALTAGFLCMKKLIKKKTAVIMAVVGASLGFIGGITGTILYGTHLQKKASRISHYQSFNDLKDPKNFVIYDNDQIEQAKQIAKTMKDEGKKGIFSKKGNKLEGEKGFFKSLSSLIKDHKKYLEWRKARDKEEGIKVQNPTPEQLAKAKVDQDVIQRTVKHINETAEDYSENMETTAGVLLGSSMVGGALIGGAFSWIFGKTGIDKKITDKASDFVKKCSKDTSIIKKMAAEHIAESFKSPKGRLRFMGVLGGFLSTIAVIYPSLMLQKHAARVGRYKAKQDLVENPKNFIYYDDQQLEQVKDVKSDKKKSLIHRLYKDLKFIPKALKETKEYKQYKKTEFQEQHKIRKALKQVELKPGQLEQGKSLQEKVFKSFDKVDEMSQRYSEDVEAATEIGMQLAPLAGYLMFLSPLAVGAYGVYKGKITIGSVAQKITGVFSKFSSLMKTKLFKNFASEIPKKIEKSAENITSRMKWFKKERNPLAESIVSEMIKGKSKESLIETLEGFKKALKSGEGSSIAKAIQSLPGNGTKGIKETTAYIEKNAAGLEKTVENLQKIVKNLPDKEFNAIKDKLSENPIVLMECMQNPSELKSIFFTPAIEKMIKAGVFTWGGVNLAGLWLVQSYLSEIQKQAGRVGTMKALQSLEDPRHFVDICPTEDLPSNVIEFPQQQKQTTGNSLLDEIRKNIANKYKS